MAGVVLGMKLLGSLVSNKGPITGRKRSSAEPASDKTATHGPLHFATVGGASSLIISTAYICCYPITLLAVATLSYTALPMLQRTKRSFQQNKQISNHGYSLLVIVLLLGAGNYLAATISSIIYHVSEHIIGLSRRESERLIRDVYRQASEYVWIRDHQGIERRIELGRLRSGDTVMVGAGEVVPVDGWVINGDALIDQQALTGEAQPSERHAGDRVMAATIVLGGRLSIRSESSGKDNSLNQLNQLLDRTESYKTRLQMKGEAWSNRMVYPVIAASTLVIPFAGTASAFSLLFSVPMNTIRSMLSLQTLTHMRRTGENGALIKDGRVLEELPRIDTVLFDKTGTLTQTRPKVDAIIACGGFDCDSLLAYAATAEQRLEHPIAKAIVDKAREQGIDVLGIHHGHYDMGLGVAVDIEGHRVHVGSARFVRRHTGGSLPPAKIARAMRQSTGNSFVLVAVDRRVEGMIELSPRLRPEVPALIEALKKRGFRELAIVSGDQEPPTRRLASHLGIDRVYADVRPQEKAGIIRRMQERGQHVCFVGDGINDAIALKQANVSVSLHNASSIAGEMAQIVMIRDSLEPLDGLFDMAKGLQKKLGHDLRFWLGFGATNALAVPLLGFGPVQSSLLYACAYTAGLLGVVERKLSFRREPDGTGPRVRHGDPHESGS